MKDISSRSDIEFLLRKFYDKAFQDPVIGFFFTRIVPLDLESHIPHIADFWESVIFSKRGYSRNVMEVHQRISDLSTIKKEHLDQWVKLFITTVDENFEGDQASLMKNRAISIATLMNLKLNHGHPGSATKS